MLRVLPEAVPMSGDETPTVQFSLSFQQPQRIGGGLLRKHGLKYQKYMNETSLYILSSSQRISIVIWPRLCWSCTLIRSVHEWRWRWTWQRRVLTGQKCTFWRTRRPGTSVFHWRCIPYTDKCDLVVFKVWSFSAALQFCRPVPSENTGWKL